MKFNMYKGLIFTGLSLFYVNVNAQTDLDFYKTNELKIKNLNELTSTPDVDFGYNFNENVSDNIEIGYYLWIEDSWYKIINANEVFNSDKNSPIYFNVKGANKHDLKIKDQLGTVYSYPIEAIEGYKVSDVIYKTNLDVLQNISEAKENQKLDEEDAFDDDVLSEKVSDAINKASLSKEEDVLMDIVNLNDSVNLGDLVEPDVVEKETTLVVEDSLKDDDTTIISSFEEATDGTIIIPENSNVITNTESVSDSAIIDLETVEVKPELGASQTEFKNAYEKAIAEGFDGTVTEWVESVNALGGETAYEQALKTGFKGTEEEWLRSLWGTDIDPEIEKKDKVAGIVSDWISQLNTSKGNSPYDLALKNGFYGTYTEWIESVIGKDGEQEFNKDVDSGFEGTYKEWIELKLKASNDEILRKEKLKKNNFVVVPNLQLPVTEDLEKILEFDLYDYYNTYFGSPLLSSSNSNVNNVQLLSTDLEYQITWFNPNQIKIIEISPNGILKYKILILDDLKTPNINVRFLIP